MKESFVPSDDQDLVARSLQNDPKAFGVLVDRYAEPVLNLVCRLVSDRTEAEDLAQDTFVAAFRALPQFRAESRFSTWLYRIAVNKCKDWLRSRRPTVGKPAGQEEEPGLDERVIDTWTPERELARKQLAEQLDRALQALPLLYREAFLLKHVEGLGYEQMGEILEAAPETLRMRVYKARLLLQRMLGALREDDRSEPGEERGIP